MTDVNVSKNQLLTQIPSFYADRYRWSVKLEFHNFAYLFLNIQALPARPSGRQWTCTYLPQRPHNKTASVSGRAFNRSVSNNYPVIQRTRLKLGECVFSVAAPRVWNLLPSKLKAASNNVAYERKLKTYLLSAAYTLKNTIGVYGLHKLCRHGTSQKINGRG